MSIKIPDDLVVFTRDISEDDPNLAAYGHTKGSLISLLEDRNIYLNAWVEDASYEDIMKISNKIMSLYQNGDIDEVKLIYTEFISALSQEPRVTQLLPIIAENTQETEDKKGAAVQYLPSPAAVLGYIVPKYVSGVIYRGLAESYASEQAARRTAMESATDNANEMIATLELQYNRARQAAVTQEISEIVAGAAAQ
jgi:F-type H+-transporting ATPase subunit gamma